MNFDHLNQWLALLANIAVLAGIIFLGLEIRQNSDLMRIEIQQSRTESAVSSLGQQYNSPYIPAIRVKLGQGLDLTEEEIIRYREWFRSVNRNQENILLQYNSGMLAENSPRSIEHFIRDIVASSAFSLRIWEEIKFVFADEYVELVDSVLSEIR